MHKLRVLDYWLSCVREQDIQRTSLDSNVNDYQKLPLDDDSILLSNQRDSVKITTSPQLKDILKKERTRQLYRNNKDSRPIFFFPIVIINGQSMPLFYVDLSEKEADILDKNSDLSFEINPWSVDTKIGVVSDTFVKLGYDEDYIEIGDSVIGFVEKITGQFTLNFQLALKELLAFIQKESNDNGYSRVSDIQNIGILKYSDFSEATLIFKKDLLFIRENAALYNNHLLDSYIMRKSDGIDFTEAPYLGGFYDFPVSRGQSIAISEVIKSDRSIVSVQGGPGTGKTTLILSVIASKLTNRALSIAKGEEQNNGFILVTSFTNKAVENVVNIIDEEYGGVLKNWLYLQLGNKEKREGAQKRIESFVDEIERGKFDRALYERLKAFLVSAEGAINETYKIREDEKFDLSDGDISLMRSVGLKGEISADSLINHISSLMRIDSKDSRGLMSSIEMSIKNDYRKIERLRVNNVILSKTLNFYEELNLKYPHVDADVKAGKAYSARVESENVPDAKEKSSLLRRLISILFKKNVQKEPCPTKSKDKNKKTVDSKVISQDEFKVRRLIEKQGCEPLHVVKKRLTQVSKEIRSLETRVGKKESLKEILRKSLSSTKEYSSLERGRLNSTADNKSIFEASLHFMYQHILKNKIEITETLLAWKSIIGGSDTDSHTYENDFSRFVSNASMPFPVLGCTLSSIHNIFNKPESTYINEKPFELAVCDEAGMVPIFCMPSILMRSVKALVIGDQKQLSPIISIDRHRISEFQYRHKLNDSTGIYNPMLSSAFQRSAFAKKSNFSDIGESVILDEHRRCQKRISDCFIDIGGYSQISNHTPKLNNEESEIYRSVSASEISFVNVEGESAGRRNTNKKEIEEISHILDELESKGIDIKSQVGIITPFQNQSMLLLNEFRRRLSHTIDRKKIGTVHAFQGSEFDIIILSLTAFNESFHINFITNTPNLLNVAVSRAKNRLIIVGDKEYMVEQEGNLKKLLKYCS
tara:strand:- start:867 stop:3833 length:2967 start_codon:yes stop_codon:yes gene_type:complete